MLGSDFTCVSYDLRGHGDSPTPPVPYSLDELVEDLEALRSPLGHDKIMSPAMPSAARSARPMPARIQSV